MCNLLKYKYIYNINYSEKVSPTVECPGGKKVYKSTLVSMLNENPKLSHDR